MNATPVPPNRKRCAVRTVLAPCERPGVFVQRWTGAGTLIAADVGQWRRGPGMRAAPILYVREIAEDKARRSMFAIVSTWNERGYPCGDRRTVPMYVAIDYPEVISEVEARAEIARLAEAHRVAMEELQRRHREVDEAAMQTQVEREPQPSPHPGGEWVTRMPNRRGPGAFAMMVSLLAATAGMRLGGAPESMRKR